MGPEGGWECLQSSIEGSQQVRTDITCRIVSCNKSDIHERTWIPSIEKENKEKSMLLGVMTKLLYPEAARDSQHMHMDAMQASQLSFSKLHVRKPQAAVQLPSCQKCRSEKDCSILIYANCFLTDSHRYQSVMK